MPQSLKTWLILSLLVMFTVSTQSRAQQNGKSKRHETRKPAYRLKSDLKNNAVHVVNYVKNGNKTGAGVYLGDGYMVTADHVMGEENVAAFFCILHNKSGELWDAKSYPKQQDHIFYKLKRGASGRVVARSKSKDLAIIKLNWRPEGLKPIKLCDTPPKVDDPLYFIGSPSGRKPGTIGVGLLKTYGYSTWTYKSGLRLSAYRFKFDGHSFNGNSGGPVVNQNGELVGVVSGGSDSYGYGIAIAAREIVALRKTINSRNAFSITNRTRSTIKFRLKFPGDKQWKQYSLKAGYYNVWWHSSGDTKPRIKFDCSFESGYQEKLYTLSTNKLTFGQNAKLVHKPKESGDYLVARPYRFTSVDGGIELYKD